MIECYYATCPKHCCNKYPDEGPYCNEDQCSATEEELKEYSIKRQQYLENIKRVK